MLHKHKSIAVCWLWLVQRFVQRRDTRHPGTSLGWVSNLFCVYFIWSFISIAFYKYCTAQYMILSLAISNINIHQAAPMTAMQCVLHGAQFSVLYSSFRFVLWFVLLFSSLSSLIVPRLSLVLSYPALLPLSILVLSAACEAEPSALGSAGQQCFTWLSRSILICILICIYILICFYIFVSIDYDYACFRCGRSCCLLVSPSRLANLSSFFYSFSFLPLCFLLFSFFSSLKLSKSSLQGHSMPKVTMLPTADARL